jgi:hypothetical protein
MAVSWTLEKELCGLVNARSTGEALCRLGLSEDPDSACRLKETHGWRRGGGETYLYRFKVISAGCSHDVVLKAVTAFSTSRTLNQLANEWVERRQLLEDEGVRTPTLYFAGRALLVEEYVGEKLATWLQRNPGSGRQLIDQVFRLAAVMDRHGFEPICVFNGLRTDGENVYVVDFGQDLGPPGVKRRRGRGQLQEAKRWLASVGSCPIDKRRAEAVYAFHLEGNACDEQRSS